MRAYFGSEPWLGLKLFEEGSFGITTNCYFILFIYLFCFFVLCFVTWRRNWWLPCPYGSRYLDKNLSESIKTNSKENDIWPKSLYQTAFEIIQEDIIWFHMFNFQCAENLRNLNLFYYFIVIKAKRSKKK